MRAPLIVIIHIIIIVIIVVVVGAGGDYICILIHKTRAGVGQTGHRHAWSSLRPGGFRGDIVATVIRRRRADGAVDVAFRHVSQAAGEERRACCWARVTSGHIGFAAVIAVVEAWLAGVVPFLVPCSKSGEGAEPDG